MIIKTLAPDLCVFADLGVLARNSVIVCQASFRAKTPRRARTLSSGQIIRVFALSLLTASVLMAAAPSSLSNRLTQDIPKDTLITLERTPCFGMCSAYKITISADGRVVFEGRHDVKKIGTAKSMISQQALRELVAAFERIGYFDLRDAYNEPEDGCKQWATDNPSAITSITIGGKSKRVEHYYGCYGIEVLAELKKLEQAIDDAVNSQRWIR
jgi:hypothetical protein